MFTGDLLSREELRYALAVWTLKNRRTAFIPMGGTKEDYYDSFVMPDLEYRFIKSFPDKNNDILNMYMAEIHLKASASRSLNPEDFRFVKLERVYPDCPDIGPDEYGYILL